MTGQPKSAQHGQRHEDWMPEWRKALQHAMHRLVFNLSRLFR